VKVAVYGRVSSDEQRETGTIEVQLHEVRKYADQNRLEIVGQYLDEGVSGAVPLADRPGGKALLEAAEAQRGRRERDIDGVLCYSMDRLGRDALQALLAIQTLKRLKAPAMFVRESFADDPAGNFQQTVMAAVAELERGLISARMSGGRQRRVREGAYLSSTVPFGYRRHPEVKGRLEVDEAQAAVVRKMYEWAVAGEGLKQIADRLDKEGVPSPMTTNPKRRGQYGWSWSTCAKILTARRYIGEGSYGGTMMTCPPVIDVATFEAARHALAKRKFDAQRNTHNFYLLRGLLWCRACGARLHGRIKQQRDGSYTNEYECSRRRSFGPKAGHENVVWRVREDEVAPRIQMAVNILLADPERALRDYSVKIERTRQEVAGAADRVQELESRLAAVPVQEARITDAFRRGVITGELFEQQMEAIREERKAMEAELREDRVLAANGEEIVAALAAVRALLANGAIRTGDTTITDAVTGEAVPIQTTVFDEERGEAVPTSSLSPQDWRRRLELVVKKVWVELDGSLTVEGPGDVVVCTTTR
jgi:site-specific DNA recombinase